MQMIPLMAAAEENPKSLDESKEERGKAVIVQHSENEDHIGSGPITLWKHRWGVGERNILIFGGLQSCPDGRLQVMTLK